MKSNLTKQEIVSIVSEKAGISKKQANLALNAVFETIQEGLTKGRKFSMTGFGTFSPNVRQPRTGVHPQTGESIVIPGKLVAKFKAGKRLAEALNSAKSIGEWVNQ
jgi:DNA-binding protein HU-beta